MKNTKIKNIIRQTINEQGGIVDVYCNPSNCICTPIFGSGSGAVIYNGGVSTVENFELCNDDLNNCCNKYDCDPDGSGACEAFPGDDTNAPYDSMVDCQNAYPQGCQPEEYDCNQGTNYVCAQQIGGQYNSMAACTSANGGQSCAPRPDTFDCLQKTGFVCANVGPSGGGQFVDPGGMAACIAAYPDGCDELDAYECNLELCQCNPDPNGQFTGPTAQADCNASLSDPTSECCCINCEQRFNCIPRGHEGGTPKGDLSPTKRKAPIKGKAPIEGGDTTKRALNEQAPSMVCVGDPAGPFSSMIACQDCVNDPMCPECNEPMGDDRYDCLDETQVDGSMQTICVINNSPGDYASLAACQAAIAQPDFICDPMGGGWDCIEGQGCVDTGTGQYPDFATCEANSDDHYNIGGVCSCICPGQPQGCDTTPLISSVPIINGEYFGMHGQPYEVGMTNLNLNDAKDKNGPLLTQAFRDRMAPCGPSYTSPNVKHDCAFWEYISTKKLPEKYTQVITPASAGGLVDPASENPWHMAHGQYPFLPWVNGAPQTHAITGQPINPYGGTPSTSGHPRWQRRMEAKIAYVRCLRQACCGNTDWPNDGQVFTPTM